MFTYRSNMSVLHNLPISPPRFVANLNDRDTYRNLIQMTVLVTRVSVSSYGRVGVWDHRFLLSLQIK